MKRAMLTMVGWVAGYLLGVAWLTRVALGPVQEQEADR